MAPRALGVRIAPLLNVESLWTEEVKKGMNEKTANMENPSPYYKRWPRERVRT